MNSSTWNIIRRQHFKKLSNSDAVGVKIFECGFRLIWEIFNESAGEASKEKKFD